MQLGEGRRFSEGEHSTPAVQSELVASLAEARLSERERLALDRFTELLRDRLGYELVSLWLYGSRARGEASGPESDIDLMVITRGGREHDFDRVLAAALEAEPLMTGEGTILAPFVAEPAWIAGRREIESFFMREVDRDKIVLEGEG